MSIEIIEFNEKVKFIVKGINPTIANTIRRAILTEVPTMAIDYAVIIENTSVLYDEILLHRLSFIPLKTDLESYKLPEKCECGGSGCSNCQVRLYLEVEAEEGSLLVTSSHLVPEDGRTFPAKENIPIVKLEKGQKVILEAYARLGLGKEKAKWQPVAACAYKYFPIIEVNEQNCSLCEDCIERCPRKTLALVDNKIVLKNPLECSLCKECEKACPEGAIKVKYDDSCFIFKFENLGALPSDVIVEKALEAIVEKALELKRLLSSK
ncbi:MAG: DNA-directed RNA polymerase subunit D [Thermoprotei archaeon]|nr:MAG: DNA-directed RNA polymerase subunit D [Thermoprotei archaeon]RLF00372.1 MAG: DNA-directed RNA polymerase subunit D [Thermoprotei archaeon]